MYIKSTHAREVGFETFLRALFYVCTPPDLRVRRKIKAHLGDHIVCLNTETALSLLFRAVPGREPGMIVAIDSTLAKQSRKVVERSGFKTVLFTGGNELIEVLKNHKVSIIYLSDHFNQGGRKTHRALAAYTGLVFMMQHRQMYRPMQASKHDLMIWRPRGFTRSSGGVVVTYKPEQKELIEVVKKKISGFHSLANSEVLKDMFYGLFGWVQHSRHVSMKPPRVVLQLIEYRLRGIVR